MNFIVLQGFAALFFLPFARLLRRATYGDLPRPATQSLALALILAAGGLQTASAQPMLLPTAQLKIGPYVAYAEIAATDSSRSYGLMNRPSLAADHGMLFVFDDTGMPCFWMKNTPLPLSIAFISEQGAIVNIADMQPHSLDSQCPAAPIRYALEMEQGWFKQRQISAGASVGGLPTP